MKITSYIKEAEIVILDDHDQIAFSYSVMESNTTINVVGLINAAVCLFNHASDMLTFVSTPKDL